MTPQEFVAKWSRVELPERAASQEHFMNLCQLLGQPTPATHDATGAEYAFEKGVDVSSGASVGHISLLRELIPRRSFRNHQPSCSQ